MEQAMVKGGRRSGWSNQESTLLWETADEAQKQGLPLKHVFERIAGQTGRRPNSIRNYYYAQVRDHIGEDKCAARFVPFSEDEVTSLMEHVLRARANGQSVRSCLQHLAHGDHSLMLRYQNKYRSVLKGRPTLVRELVEKLNGEGIACDTPQVRARSHPTVEEACQRLNAGAREVGDEELARACEVLTQTILANRDDEHGNEGERDRLNVRVDLYRLAMTRQSELISRLSEAASDLTCEIKEFVILDKAGRMARLDDFCEAMTSRIGMLEGLVTDAEGAEAAGC